MNGTKRVSLFLSFFLCSPYYYFPNSTVNMDIKTKKGEAACKRNHQQSTSTKVFSPEQFISMTRSTQLFVFLFLSPRRPLHRAPRKSMLVLLNTPESSYRNNEYYLHLYVKCKYILLFCLVYRTKWNSPFLA